MSKLLLVNRGSISLCSKRYQLIYACRRISSDQVAAQRQLKNIKTELL